MEAESSDQGILPDSGLAVRRFTVDELHRLDEAGVLHPDDRVELVGGRIVEMAAIGNRHAACRRRLNHRLNESARDEFIVGVASPVHLHVFTLLMPDLTLFRYRDDFYDAGHPRPDDVLLVVEVADSTLEFDRGVKIPHYGRAGIPEAWIVNLPERRVEVFRNPQVEGDYRETFQVPEGESLVPVFFPRIFLNVADILGPPENG